MKQQIRALQQKGLTPDDIAEVLNCSRVKVDVAISGNDDYYDLLCKAERARQLGCHDDFHGVWNDYHQAASPDKIISLIHDATFVQALKELVEDTQDE